MRTETQLEIRWFQPTGREVSRDGYKWAIRAGTVTPQRARILSELAAHGRPLTRHELADACSAQPNAPRMEVSSVCGRVHELLDSGQIAVVGIQSRKAAPSRQQLGLTPTGWSLFEATGAA